jgi:hypothetical protein
MKQTKTCPDCSLVLPIEDFQRRLGQPYFVSQGRAWAEEPLRERTEMASCIACFVVAVLRETRCEAG